MGQTWIISLVCGRFSGLYRDVPGAKQQGGAENGYRKHVLLDDGVC